MAQLALSVAGFATGIPWLGAIGGFVGGVIDNSLIFPALFPAPGPLQGATAGPRIGDMSLSSSTYGIAIPVGLGAFRMSGNMIWMKGNKIDEHVIVSSSETGGGGGGNAVGKGLGSALGGGKNSGGGGLVITQTTYTYSASFAMGFGEGIAKKVLRIWADTKLIYDITGTGVISKSGLTFRFYPGNETQLPDALIVAEKGAGFVPAHRGLVYIVFEDLALADFGNRLPQIFAEIAFEAQDVTTVRKSVDETYIDNIDVDVGPSLSVDYKRRRIYTFFFGPASSLIVYDLDTLQEIRNQPIDDIFSIPPTEADEFGVGSSSSSITVGDDGFLYLAAEGGHLNRPIVKVDPNTLLEVARFGLDDNESVVPDTFGLVQEMMEITGIDPFGQGRKHYLVTITGNNGDPLNTKLGVLDADTMSYLYDAYDDNTLTDPADPADIYDGPGMVPMPPQVGIASGWIMTRPLAGFTAEEAPAWANGPLHIFKVEVDFSGTPVASIELVDTITSSAWNDIGTAAPSGMAGPIYDQADGGLIFIMPINDAGDYGLDGSYIFKWRAGEGVVWSTRVATVPPNSFVWAGSLPGISSQITNGKFAWQGWNQESATFIDTTDGSTITDVVSMPALPSTTSQFYSGETQSIIELLNDDVALRQAFLGRAAAGTTTIKSAIENISARVGLDVLSEVDAEDAEDDVLRGYAITQQMPARSAVEPLTTRAFLDAIESGSKIIFRKRGGASTFSLVRSGLVPLSDQAGIVVTETRMQEVEVPRRLSVNYIDVDRDYQRGSIPSPRVRAPMKTMQSSDDQSIEVPIVLTATEARQLGEKLLFTIWNERVNLSWKADISTIEIDTADVGTIDMENGNSERVRVTKAVLNGDLSVSFEGMREKEITFHSDSVSSGGSPAPQTLPPPPAFTKLFLLDIPLLRDVDDAGGTTSTLYLAMSSYADRWRGASLWAGTDGVSFGDTGVRVLAPAAFGAVRNALPDTDLPFQTDRATVLTVDMTRGSLESVTDDQFMNNMNVALIGDIATQRWEIVGFKNAERQPGGEYLIDTLLRGLRGTDINVGSHVAGELFILLAPGTIKATALPLSMLNQVYYFRAVTFGQLLEDADTLSMKSTGADLRPYSPCHLSATTDATDITFIWTRRTRIGGDVHSGMEVPLGERTERYEIDVLDGPGGDVLRTLSATTPTATYLNADIISDFGSTFPTEISFRAYQLSDVVGRGYGTETTIEF